MFLQLSHTKTDVFREAKQLLLSCYHATKSFPPEEKFALTQQIRRAALSVHLNIAEGCTRNSDAERKRYFEVARGSVVEVDTAFDIAVALEFTTAESLRPTGEHIVSTFRQLSAMIKKNYE